MLFILENSSLMKRQLAFILARAQIPLEWLQPSSDGDAEIATEEELSDDLLECLYNTKLSTHFRDFGKELGVADAKSLEDIYKSHLENTRKLPLWFNCFLCSPFPIQDLVFRPTSILPEETWREHL
jgi:hypothetical protein